MDFPDYTELEYEDPAKKMQELALLVQNFKALNVAKPEVVSKPKEKVVVEQDDAEFIVKTPSQRQVVPKKPVAVSQEEDDGEF